jgi:hypothetical protein
MVQAIGHCQSEFDPTDPGRLCRGQERWIDSFDLEDGVAMHRIVLSGALFSDDSARDAQRGLVFSGIDGDALLRALFPDRIFIACAEEGHPREVPTDATGVEHYPNHRPGGALEQWVTRWVLNCDGEGDTIRAFEAGADVLLVFKEAPKTSKASKAGSSIYDVPMADGVLDEAAAARDTLPEPVREGLFLLMGHRQDGQPARRFQAAAIPSLMEHVEAIVLLHSDKHGGCFGIYTPKHLEAVPTVDRFATDVGALSVPFAIAPMLARWDRAIWELRQEWDEASQGEFPVPPCPNGGWNRRERRSQAKPPVAEALSITEE